MSLAASSAASVVIGSEAVPKNGTALLLLIYRYLLFSAYMYILPVVGWRCSDEHSASSKPCIGGLLRCREGSLQRRQEALQRNKILNFAERRSCDAGRRNV